MFIKTVYMATFAVWLASFASISIFVHDFSMQIPVCMGSTIAIFSIATLIVKHHEKKHGKTS